MRKVRIPRYSLHRATGQARVCIDGRDHYLGAFDSAESKERYRELIDKWRLRHKARGDAGLTIGELVLLFDAHALTYYVKNGKSTSEYGLIKLAMRSLVKMHSRTMIVDFGPRDLKAVRDDMVKPDKNGERMARETVNAFTRRIVRMFRWGVGEEYVAPDVLVALEAVPGLRKGRTSARETGPVKPVSEADINATLPHLSGPLRDMVRLQLLTGCRPGEIVSMRPCDVNRDGETWEFVPTSHKTEHHERGRRIYIGPRAQVILAPYLDNRPAEAFCFSPIESVEERRAVDHAARKTPLSCGNRPGTNRKGNPNWKPGEQYTAGTYRQAVHRACVAAKVPKWSPNRLRHSRATDLRRKFGIEMTRTVLGHSKLGTSEIYAEQDYARARQMMAEVG